jgi:hypothetical protein
MIDAQSANFESKGWLVHSWPYANQKVTVLQREPFRLTWLATQLVTFVYIIRRTPDDYQSVLNDYSALRSFAGNHKRTPLPFTIQCGYALLPIYIGHSFSESLITDIQTTYKKRWCVIHVPSLLESDTGGLHTLEAKSFWGCVYRDFVRATVADTARAIAGLQQVK